MSVDAFGEAYVIPIQDTLRDIQRYLQAVYVSLPSGRVLQSLRNLGLGTPLEQESAPLAGRSQSTDLTPTAASDVPDIGHTTSTKPLQQMAQYEPDELPVPISPEAPPSHPSGNITDSGTTRRKRGNMRKALGKIFGRTKKKSPTNPKPTTTAPPLKYDPFAVYKPPVFPPGLSYVTPSPAPAGFQPAMYGGVEKHQYQGVFSSDSGYASLASSAVPSPAGSPSAPIVATPDPAYAQYPHYYQPAANYPQPAPYHQELA